MIMDTGEFDHQKIQEYLRNDAVIIDVREPHEYDEGHCEGSENIPLPTIPMHAQEIQDKNRPIIAVCRSGNRSGQAMDFLKEMGVDIINGGPWENVDQYL